MLVLWWISFQVTVFCCPVVLDMPTVNINLASNACLSNFSMCRPSLLSGKYAVLLVPV